MPQSNGANLWRTPDKRLAVGLHPKNIKGKGKSRQQLDGKQIHFTDSQRRRLARRGLNVSAGSTLRGDQMRRDYNQGVERDAAPAAR